MGKYQKEDEKRKHLTEWASKIEKSARQLCNDPEGKGIKVEVEKAGINDKESLDV